MALTARRIDREQALVTAEVLNLMQFVINHGGQVTSLPFSPAAILQAEQAGLIARDVERNVFRIPCMPKD